MSVLELTSVSKRFGGLQALSEISLSVSSGEVLGLIGPNGAGKSTLVSCITGVLRIDAGNIRFGAREPLVRARDRVADGVPAVVGAGCRARREPHAGAGWIGRGLRRDREVVA